MYSPTFVSPPLPPSPLPSLTTLMRQKNEGSSWAWGATEMWHALLHLLIICLCVTFVNVCWFLQKLFLSSFFFLFICRNCFSSVPFILRTSYYPALSSSVNCNMFCLFFRQPYPSQTLSRLNYCDEPPPSMRSFFAHYFFPSFPFFPIKNNPALTFWWMTACWGWLISTTTDKEVTF